MHSSRMRYALLFTVRRRGRGGSLSRGVCVGGGEGSVQGVSLTETPLVNRITDICKNITLPQLHCRR